MEGAVVMEAAAGARWRTYFRQRAGNEARAHPFVGTPEGPTPSSGPLADPYRFTQLTLVCV